MRIEYDPEADAAMVYLLEGPRQVNAPESHVCDLEVEEAAIILHLTEDMRLVEIEILGASKILPPELLQ